MLMSLITRAVSRGPGGLPRAQDDGKAQLRGTAETLPVNWCERVRPITPFSERGRQAACA